MFQTQVFRNYRASSLLGVIPASLPLSPVCFYTINYPVKVTVTQKGYSFALFACRTSQNCKHISMKSGEIGRGTRDLF